MRARVVDRMVARFDRLGGIMNKVTMTIVALLSLGLLAQDADARRLGGGASIGKQRQMITPAPKAPAQAPSAAPATPAQQPSGMSKWLGRPGGVASGAGAVAAVTASPYPAGFDAEQFVRHAKLNFTQLQQANDKRDLSTMRDFMTPPLYAEVAAEVEARGDAQQQTDAVTLNAEVVEVVTEGDVYVASVRF